MAKVILINGVKRSGKDYSAQILKEELESRVKKVEIFHFAAPLKQIIADTFELSLKDLDKMKNNPDDYNLMGRTRLGAKTLDKLFMEFNFRTILQRFGTEAMRPHFGKDVWAKLLVDKVKRSDADVILVPDFRFLEEYNYCNDSFSGTYGLSNTKMNDMITMYIESGKSSKDTHSSEMKPDVEFQFSIDNTKQDESLKTQLVDFIEKL